MPTLLTVIGARPQIIKAAALSRAIRNHFPGQIREIILHTGQHYDGNMSQVFIDELELPTPDYKLDVRSGSHARQTANMLTGIESALQEVKPDFLIVYGDTNSTLAGALAGAKLHYPVVHVEAGLRSFNKAMPEEINRITADHVSTLLFSPTKTGYQNLIREGFSENTKPPYSINNPKIYHCGDIMFDNSLYYAKIAESKSHIIEELGLQSGKFLLATIHRDNNTDIPVRINEIFLGLHRIINQANIPMVIPLHPRTRKVLKQHLEAKLFDEILKNQLMKIIEPVSFLDMIRLEKESQLILTDSGGVQKESYFFKKPCIILRPETEWKEIVEQGTAILADASTENIVNAYSKLISKKSYSFPEIFGDGHAAEFICEKLLP